MNATETSRFRNAVISQLRISDFQYPVAVTLNLKQCYYSKDIRIPLTDTNASQNLHHFLNVLSRKAFRKSGVRKGKRISCYAVIEGDGKFTRHHYHICLDKPEELTIEQFTTLIHATWSKTNFGYKRNKIKWSCDNGWIRYMTKYKTKPNFADSIDWLNYYNSERGV